VASQSWPQSSTCPTTARSPALVFRFIDPLGQFYPPFVLVQDDDQMAKMRPLLFQAIAAARKSASDAARRDTG